MKSLFKSSIPASLARRLGEAADGFRNVGEVYFVAGYGKPHKIKHFFDSDSAAKFMDGLKEDKDKFEIFGPFVTKDELENDHLTGAEDIVSIDLTIKYKDGNEHKQTLKGNIDSIFLNLSSFDKFVFPYYCHVYGAGYAKEFRDKVIASYKKMPGDAVKKEKDPDKKPPSGRPHLICTLLPPFTDEETWAEQDV